MKENLKLTLFLIFIISFLLRKKTNIPYHRCFNHLKRGKIIQLSLTIKSPICMYIEMCKLASMNNNVHVSLKPQHFNYNKETALLLCENYKDVTFWISAREHHEKEIEYEFAYFLKYKKINCGLTVSCSHNSCVKTVENCVKNKISVRLVKGLYYGKDLNRNQNYLTCSNILWNDSVENSIIHFLASHDMNLLKQLKKNEIPPKTLKLAFYENSYKCINVDSRFSNDYALQISIGKNFDSFSFDLMKFDIISLFNHAKNNIKCVKL